MSAKHSITIEVSDEEYETLRTLAEDEGTSLGELARRCLLNRGDDETNDGDTSDRWKSTFDIADELRSFLKPFGPGEFSEFIKELREDRNARPSRP